MGTIDVPIEDRRIRKAQLDLQVVIHRDEESDSFWASVVQLPGCYATGRSRKELLVALEEAIGLYLEDDTSPERVEVKKFRLTKKTGLVPA